MVPVILFIPFSFSALKDYLKPVQIDLKYDQTVESAAFFGVLRLDASLVTA